MTFCRFVFACVLSVKLTVIIWVMDLWTFSLLSLPDQGLLQRSEAGLQHTHRHQAEGRLGGGGGGGGEPRERRQRATHTHTHTHRIRPISKMVGGRKRFSFLTQKSRLKLSECFALLY